MATEGEAPKESHKGTCTGRVSRPAIRFANEQAKHEANEVAEYSTDTAKIIANVIHDYNLATVDKSTFV